MSNPDTKEYKALFKENDDKINSKMAGLFYQVDPSIDNKWAKLTVENLTESVKNMNEEYLRRVLLGEATDAEKEYMEKLEKELARRIEAEKLNLEPPKIVSLFGEQDE